MKYYEDYYNDLAKLFGASSNPVVVGDTWLNLFHIRTVDGIQVLDFRTFGGNPIPFAVTPAKCIYYGNWTVFGFPAPFVVGGSVSFNFQAVQPGGGNYVGLAGFNRSYAAATTQVPFSDYYQFPDMAVANVGIISCAGANNEYDVYVKFDGVKITWGGN